MKKILILGFVLLSWHPNNYAKMPTNGDYSNWDWENNNQDNWKRKDGSTWREIRPAFAPATEKAGLMVNIYGTMDFTKAKGWKLIYADFGGEYPYFVLYNTHKSIVRTYVYTEGTPIYSHILVVLKSDNPTFRVLSLVENGVNAIESANPNKADYLSCIIPGIGLNTWAVAEFPILFDYKNVGGAANYLWTFSFYACDQFNIQLNLNGTSVPANSWSTYNLAGQSDPVSGSTFNASLTKLNTNVQSIQKLIEGMHASADKILANTSNESILKDYANLVKSVKNYTDVVHAVSSGTSALSAIVGFVRMIFGVTDPQSSTPPVTYIQQATISGTMSIQRPLRSATLSIPGALSYYPSNLAWQPYNCPIGIINLKKEPTIKRTTPYGRYANNDNGQTQPRSSNNKPALYNVIECPGNILIAKDETPEICTSCSPKYSGKHIKCKFNEDIVIAKQNIDGLTLLNVKFALVCKPSGTGDKKYPINTPYIASHYFYSTNGIRYAVKATNMVYKAIKEGQLIIHKYDEENDEIYFGTPYVSMNQFKGVTIEVPEDTEVKLGVLATFQSDKYNDLIVFKTMYNIKLDPTPETFNGKWCLMGGEMTNFPFSDYYESTKYQLNNSPNSNTYTGKQIILKPGFKSGTGFHATARDYKSNGNTAIDAYNYYCGNSMRSSENTTEIKTIDNKQSEVNLYPNPCYGVLFVKLPDKVKSAEIEIYDLSGSKVKSFTHINNESVLDVSTLHKGSYIFKIITADGTYSRKVLVN